VQGKGAEDFVRFVLEPVILRAAKIGYETELDPSLASPHMGVDESGKGDFFGPLVIAAAYVDPVLFDKFKEMNVRDSKRITSDNVALGMGRELRRLLGNRCALVKIGPRAYNRLYAKMLNVNRILAWGHARAIENLLGSVPECPRAVSDQFGSASQVERALMKNGRKIDLIQRHKAESDPAVAAASIIAREQFLLSLKEIADKTHIKVPKGASEGTRESAVELVRRHGPASLLDYAKCHFRTADEVLGILGLGRDALGPDGRAVSRPRREFRTPAHKSPEQA
jgi:ribonuclease HIII